MTDQQFVLDRTPGATCVRGRHPWPFGPIRYRIKYAHSPRAYGCNWCTTEARAWRAARQRILHKLWNRDR